jgi:ATP-dependent protease HslVU (ClpYQ) peptidase subunit
MTVIVSALTKADGIVIAADSRVTQGEIEEDGFPYKLWTNKNYIFGGAGGVRELQTLQYHVEWPKWRPDEYDVMKFAVTEVVPSIKSGIEDLGVLNDKKGSHTLDILTVMAWEENLIQISTDFSILPAVNGRIAIGAGQAQVYGFLGDSGTWTKKDVIEAVRRASTTGVGVGGDIYYVSTKDPKVRKA